MDDEYTIKYSHHRDDLTRLKMYSSNSRRNSINISGKIIIRGHLRINLINCNDSTIEIGADCSIGGLLIVMFGSGNHLKIGDRCTFGSDNEIELGDGVVNNRATPIHIGEDCMFSKRTIIKNGDGHPIIERKTKRQLNIPKSGVFLGDHVWVGLNSTILKGVTIGDCCVIAANALVTRDAPPNSTIVGVNKIVPSAGIWSRAKSERSCSEALYYFFKTTGFQHDDIVSFFERHNDLVGRYRDVFEAAARKMRQCDVYSPAFFREVARFLEPTHEEAAVAFFEVADRMMEPQQHEKQSLHSRARKYFQRILPSRT